MRKIKVVLLICTAVLLLLTVGCGEKKELDMGETKDGVYKNEYFGLEVKVPEEWVSLTTEEIEKEKEEAEKLMVKEEDEENDEEENIELSFLVVKKYAQDKMEGRLINPNYVLTAKKLGFIDEIAVKDGRAYLKEVRRELKKQSEKYSLNYKIDEKINLEKINGVDWYKLYFHIQVSDELKMQQVCYAVVRDGYGISFTATYPEIIEKKKEVEEKSDKDDSEQEQSDSPEESSKEDSSEEDIDEENKLKEEIQEIIESLKVCKEDKE